MSLDEAIIAALRHNEGFKLSVAFIAEDASVWLGREATQAEVQAALHQLDDAGRVLMRNGWYQLSQAERAKA